MSGLALPHVHSNVCYTGKYEIHREQHQMEILSIPLFSTTKLTPKDHNSTAMPCPQATKWSYFVNSMKASFMIIEIKNLILHMYESSLSYIYFTLEC